MFGHEGMGAEGGAKGSGPDYAPTVQSGRAAGSRVQRRDAARRCVLGRLGGKRPTHPHGRSLCCTAETNTTG